MNNMINYSKKNINIISFFISLIVFLSIVFSIKIINFNQNNNFEISKNEDVLNYIKNEPIINDINIEEVTKWIIIIDKLNLKAQIKDGIEENVIKDYVGHYKKSNVLYGNVSLKAHNIGENKNYFANIKELEIGDKIRYIVNENEIFYKVISNIIIDDEEEYAMKKYDKNTITLITYIKDLDDKKRCVIAEQIGRN